MSQPEPAPRNGPVPADDTRNDRPATDAAPPEVDWAAVERGCPCPTCEAARRSGARGPAQERPATEARSVDAQVPSATADLERRMAGLERKLEELLDRAADGPPPKPDLGERLDRLEGKLDALLAASRPRDAGGGTLGRIADEVDRLIADLIDPESRRR